ncbi:hypothetical protein HPB50_016390 [Hyalomma asiaticum]|uniref:Uncharacterized protein n=1 Tax=Hyalomma asiaticum TaxID=266040 RepID=A0ACB7SVD0_HYAAI|nr:hypothetical protein HPB50_016390 [Hyalomma asiaticum]
MDTGKMEIEKLTAVGKELGLEGAELREWVEEQQEWERKEREWAREDKERKRIAAKEAEELQLKLQLTKLRTTKIAQQLHVEFHSRQTLMSTAEHRQQTTRSSHLAQNDPKMPFATRLP